MITQTLRQNDRYTIDFPQSDVFTWRVTLTDPDGNALDITATEVDLYARENSHDVSTSWVLSGTPVGSDPTTGQVDFSFDTPETGAVRTYLCEIKLDTGAGHVETYIEFTLRINSAYSV